MGAGYSVRDVTTASDYVAQLPCFLGWLLERNKYSCGGHFRNAIRSQHTRRDQLRHVTVILAKAFSTMAALLGIWTLLHFSGMLLAPASKGHKVVFTGCLLATVGGFGGLTWVVIERNWLWWMALAISGWMFGVWMLILSSVDPPLVRSRSDIGFFHQLSGGQFMKHQNR